MRHLLKTLLVIAALAASHVHANPIFFEASTLGGDRWEYRYTVDNRTADPVEEFTIYFDLGLYEDLVITGSPNVDWDGLAIQPDPELPDDGFADWLAFGPAIASGELLSGFSVTFDWLSAGTPGSQWFEIVDPLDFSVLSSGFTQPLVAAPVPEPGPLLLLGSGALWLLRRRRPETKSRRHRQLRGLRLSVLTCLGLVLLAGASFAGTGDVTVMERQLVGSQRVGRAHIDYTYTITVANAGGALDNAVATVASQSPNTEIIESEVVLGHLPGGTTLSSDTFTLRQNRRVPFDPTDLVWTFAAEEPPPAGDNPPVITSTPITAASLATAYGYDVNATDPDAGDVLSYSLLTAPAGMIIDTATGRISWTPGSTGPADVDVQVQDSAGLTDRQIYLIQVSQGGDDQPPVLMPIAGQSTLIGHAMMTLAVGSDPEGEPIRYGLSQSPQGMAVNTTTGEILWTPTPDQTGISQVVVTATDPGGQSAQTAFSVTVLAEAQNSTPVLAHLDDVSVSAGERVQVVLSATDGDAGDLLTFGLAGVPENGAFDASLGIFTWPTSSADVGTIELTASVTDSAGVAAQQTFAITVAALPVAPVAVDDAYTLRRTETLNVAAPGVLANDHDANGDPLTASATRDPELGTLTALAPDGGFSYQPPPVASMTIGLDIDCQAPGTFSTTGIATADIDHDGDIELVAVMSRGTASRLLIVSGSDCTIESNIDLDPDLGQTGFYATPTLVNLDQDPDLEIVVPYLRFSASVPFGTRSRLLALNRDGTPVWTTPGGLSEAVSFNAVSTSETTKGPTAVDLDGDGFPELVHGWANVSGPYPQNVVGSAVVAYAGRTGEILWEYLGPPQATLANAPKSPLVADLDLDGSVEVIWHTSVLNADGQLEFLLPTELTLPGAIGSRPLTTAIANFDTDPYPEIIAFDNLHHYLYEHTGALKWRRDYPAGATFSTLSLPHADITVAQLDDDPEPEYVSSFRPPGTSYYRLVAFDTDGSVLWDHHDRNWLIDELLGERVTTPVAFDFQRDGVDELVVAHPGGGALAEGVYVFDGATGDILASAPALVRNPGGVALTVADVDGDGEAEILSVSATSFGFDDTLQIWQGLPGNPFPPGRPIRNQSTYQPTWVADDGTIPTYPAPHWLIPGLNKFYASAVIPGEDTSTVDHFAYRASDGQADSNEASVRITLADVNAPSIVASPIEGASPGFEYHYGLLATDADFGDLLGWTLVSGPAGMNLDTFGVLTWTPADTDLGEHRVHVVVTDAAGNTDDQIFRVAVVPAVVVPDVVGSEEADASANLATAGLAVGNVTYAFSLSAPAGAVISQSVAGGAESAAGVPVDYVVSQGPPPIYLPDFGTLTLATASAALQDLTLAVGTVTWQNDDSLARGQVISQSLDPLTEVTSGTSVDLVVSGGPAIALDLAGTLLGDGESMSYQVTSFDTHGQPQPLPGDLSLAVEPLEDAAGPLPTLTGTTIDTAPGTRGGYVLRVQSASLGLDRSAGFLVAGVFGDDGVQSAYAGFSEQLNRLLAIYEGLGEAIVAGDVITIQQMAAELAGLRAAVDLDELALTPAVGLETGFFPDAPPGVPGSADEAFAGQIGPTLGAIAASRGFLARLNAGAARNDDIRAGFLNRQLDEQLSRFAMAPLTPRGTVAYRSALHEILSVAVPELVLADVDTVLAALGDAGLAARTGSIDALYADTAIPAVGERRVRPVFFTIGGLIAASKVRMRLVKRVYFPIVKQVMKNTQNLIAEGLLKQFFGPAAIPGIVTGASQSFHAFELQNSIIEAYVHAGYPSAIRVQMIGPTLVADLADSVSGLRDVQFDSMQAVKKSFEAVKTAAASAATTVQDGFAETSPDQLLRGCVFDTAVDCQQLGFGDGLPVVHKSGAFPGPVLFIVYDAASANVSIGNFLFVPKSG